jgi:molecular chaperone GrpE
MSEPSSSSIVGDVAASGSGTALSPEEIADILSEFRLWLVNLSQAPSPPPPPDFVDLQTLVGQFTALRQEVNLQTRAVRTQQEQNAETLRQNAALVQALERADAKQNEQLDDNRAREQDSLLRPLLKALVEIADSQILAIRELSRVVDKVDTLLTAPCAESGAEVVRTGNHLLPYPPAMGFWARLTGTAQLAEYQRQLAAQSANTVSHDMSTSLIAEETISQIRGILNSALAGLQLGLQRMERVMVEYQLQPILSVGEAFDPERMEVVEVVSDSGRRTSEVIEELRRGYIWKGKVFRFAQVRVAK